MDEDLSLISARIQNQFEKATKNCSCNYNHELFQTILREYINLRLKVHHMRKRHGVDYSLLNRTTMARHRLEILAPCQDCIARINPTHRARPNVWNPKRQRAYKEALR
jgi:hypothetical protein